EEKLTNGSLIALDILEKCCNNQMNFEFYHIVLCKNWSSPEYRVITSKNYGLEGRSIASYLKSVVFLSLWSCLV
ncbi:MAG: hypothetical protein ACPLZG_12675, partial [Thermoproteota archaeon]